MQPNRTHDEQAMQDFVRDFRRYLKQDVMPGIRQIFETKVAPTHERETGKPFENYHEVRRAMVANDYYQFWSAMQRRSQEMMWESVLDPTERELEALIARFEKIEKRIDATEGEIESYDLGKRKSLSDEIAELEAESSIEKELEALKARVGNTPKA